MGRRLLIALFVAGGLAGCGGGGSPAKPPAQAPGVGGLERAVGAAQGAVSQSQQDAQRAEQTSAGQ
ncbi:MAG: hypothetical protein QOE27_1493 [Solirubrobacteraceae bacterium]|jgi:hypothetical protein|nr:hypothetical protein [Solirubrobacteraceae bacterium]